MKIQFVLVNLIHESCPPPHHRSYLGFRRILTLKCQNTTCFILIRQVSRCLAYALREGSSIRAADQDIH